MFISFWEYIGGVTALLVTFLLPRTVSYHPKIESRHRADVSFPNCPSLHLTEDHFHSLQCNAPMVENNPKRKKEGSYDRLI